MEHWRNMHADRGKDNATEIAEDDAACEALGLAPRSITADMVDEQQERLSLLGRILVTKHLVYACLRVSVTLFSLTLIWLLRWFDLY